MCFMLNIVGLLLTCGIEVRDAGDLGDVGVGSIEDLGKDFWSGFAHLRPACTPPAWAQRVVTMEAMEQRRRGGREGFRRRST